MTSLFERISWAQENLAPVVSKYSVVFEPEIDAPCAVMTPAPEWMAMALHGDLLPPVEAYHQLEVKDGQVQNGHVLHEETIPAMNEEEAIEYLIMKDLPIAVWKDTTGNRPKFKICKRESIPTDRRYRNAWSLTA